MDHEPVWHSETVGPRLGVYAVDFTSCYKFWTNHTHLICRNLICQPSAIAITRVKQRAFAFKSCSFYIQQGYPGFFALITVIFSAVKHATDGIPRVCFTSLTSFVYKRMLTNSVRGVIGVLNGSRRFRDRLTLPILHKLTKIIGVANTSGVRAGENLRFYISNVLRWMERVTITKTLKGMICGVPPSDLSRNVDIKHWGVLTWISDSSPISRQN